METMYELIERVNPAQSRAIIKHLKAVGIDSFETLTKGKLMELRDHLREMLAPSSAKTIAASFAAFLHRYEDGVIPCKGFAEILSIRGERCQKTYLTPEEIKRLEQVEVRSLTEQVVLDEFLIGCKTGARISDIRHLTAENIQDGLLTYTSQKTGITASVPCSARTLERVERVKANGCDMFLSTYNDTIRRLCRRAGINAPVKVHKGGKDMAGEKWQFISSHSARISTCTNLANMGVPMQDIAHIAGHTDIGMTFRYVVRTAPKLNDKALKLFE